MSGAVQGEEKLAVSEGTVIVGDSSGLGSELDVSTSGQIVVGDGTTIASVAVSGDATLSSAGAVAVTTVDDNVYQRTATARTATSDGLTTGTIADGTTFVTVTSASADNIIVLPTPTPGTVVYLRNAGTGYELRSSSPTTIGINGGTGADVESAIGANVLVRCVCDTATTWVCNNFSTAGAVTATQVAA